jgi:hypothetical protein
MRLAVRGASILFAACLWVSPSAYAADPAPLPDGFRAEPTVVVLGVFASAVSYKNQFDHLDALRKLDLACIARGRIVERVGDENRVYTAWWLYRSDTESAVFRRNVTANLDYEACRVTYGEKREVFRSVEKAGKWPSPFYGGKVRCSGSGTKCHSMKMFGVKARCSSVGNGFQLTRYCVSIERGPTRGLLLESAYISDDMTGSGFEVREVRSGVPIDASLFDPARSW